MFPAKFQIKTKFPQNGQSLLEIIATIAIGTVLILALVALAVRSQGASDFSKASSQAANLASEGMEGILSLKAANSAHIWFVDNCNGSPSGPITWQALFVENIGSDNGAGECIYGVPGQISQPPSSLHSAECVSDWCLDFGTSGSTITLEGRNFLRTVYVADTPLNAGGVSQCNENDISKSTYNNDWGFIKQFTVVVSWTDSSGNHDSKTTSCIRR